MSIEWVILLVLVGFGFVVAVSLDLMHERLKELDLRALRGDNQLADLITKLDEKLEALNPAPWAQPPATGYYSGFNPGSWYSSGIPSLPTGSGQPDPSA